MKRLLPATLAALALSFTACSDPSEAYTPVDQLPSAQTDRAVDDTAAATEAETASEFTSEPEVTPLHEPVPTDPMPTPTDPEIPPMDPTPSPLEDATRPPPVDPALDDKEPVTQTP